MANYTAADVKRLREETDAPMMECKAALDEADGDFEKAKAILREKGKVAAGKRAGRATSAGVVAFASNADSSVVGAVMLECETDFVARNEDFIALAQQMAEKVRDGSTADGLKHLAEDAVAKIRENIQVAKAIRLEGPSIATYVHHDRTKGTAIVLEGDVADAEAVRKVAVHAAAFPPEVINKEELSQEKLDAEIEIETQRAMNEGKPENIARNIAQGRVNKEFIKTAVLMEQPFYLDPSKTVGQYMGEVAKGVKITQFVNFIVGSGS
jgi:elongation factor Ts